RRHEGVEGLRVEELHSGLRELGTEQHREEAADGEEEERGDEVLDPDHLVVGVDLEVVLPAVRPVVRVVVHQRRAPRDPVEPVVEGADAEQEADRRRDHPGDEDDVLPVVDGIPAGERTERDDDVHPDQEEERRDPQRAQVARAHEDAAAARGRVALLELVLAVLVEGGGQFASFPLRNATSPESSAGESVFPKGVGITPGWYPETMTASGSTIDCSMY